MLRTCLVLSPVWCGKSGDSWILCFFSCGSSGLRPHVETGPPPPAHSPPLLSSQDSLAAEIEGTMRKELQLEEPESPDITYGCMAFLFQVPTD